MSRQQTFTMIKPDATTANHIGAILHMYETKGLKVLALKKTILSKSDAETFYAVHKERSFFRELIDFITSGPVILIALEGENAVALVREIMGHTDPQKAAEGTIRNLFAKTIDANAVHGSDSLENAAIELAFFFSKRDLIN